MTSLAETTALERVKHARVARLGTVDEAGRPHLVPVVFALTDGRDGALRRLITAVDGKPKKSHRLRRLANIATNPDVSLLVDHYEEAWDRLWWVRLDGAATVVTDEPDRSRLLTPLIDKYEHYTDEPPLGPVVAVEIRTVSSWAAAAASAGD